MMRGDRALRERFFAMLFQDGRAADTRLASYRFKYAHGFEGSMSSGMFSGSQACRTSIRLMRHHRLEDLAPRTPVQAYTNSAGPTLVDTVHAAPRLATLSRLRL